MGVLTEGRGAGVTAEIAATAAASFRFNLLLALVESWDNGIDTLAATTTAAPPAADVGAALLDFAADLATFDDGALVGVREAAEGTSDNRLNLLDTDSAAVWPAPPAPDDLLTTCFAAGPAERETPGR